MSYRTNRDRIQARCNELNLNVDCIDFYPQHDVCPSTGEVVCTGGYWVVYLADRPEPFTTSQDEYDRMDIDDEVSILLARLTEYANAL